MTDQPDRTSPAPTDPPNPGPATDPSPTQAYEPAGPIPEPRINTVTGQAYPADTDERPELIETGTFGASSAAAAANPGRRSSGTRWAVALGGLALVVGVSAAIVFLVSGRPAASAGAGWMPAGVVQYGELRLDLPGDQRAKFAAFLANFPGFKDQTQVEVKVNDVLDRIVREVTSDEQTWTADIGPWFGGQVAYGMSPPSATGPTSVMGAAVDTLVVAITVRDATLAEAWMTKATDDAGLTSSSHGSATIWTGPDFDGGSFSWAVTDQVLLIGTTAAVKASIDTGGRGTLASDEAFKAAFATVRGDVVAFSYLNLRAYVDAALAQADVAELAETQVDDELLALLPAWQASWTRIENDALVGESAYPSIDLGFEASNRPSTLTGFAPPATLAYLESHDLGRAITTLVDRFRDLPELEAGFAEFDRALGVLGGFEATVGWWGDAALIIGTDATGTLGGGLVIDPADPAAAERLSEVIGSFLLLGGGQVGAEIREEDHQGATIRIVDVATAAGSAGVVPPGVGTELAWTVTDEVVVIGYGPGFVRSVLDAGPGPSLADDARFAGFVDRIGKDQLGLTYVDIRAVREALEPLLEESMPAEEWAFYESDIRPYLEHVDAMISGVRTDGTLDHAPSLVIVKE